MPSTNVSSQWVSGNLTFYDKTKTEIAKFDGTNGLLDVVASKLAIGGTAVTASAAELNALASTGLSATELGYLNGVTAGTRTVSKALVVGASGEIDAFNVAQTITSATPATTRILHSALTLTPSTTISVASSGSLAGVRGEITVTTGKTFVDGFLYGVQGKVTLNGTLAESSAGRITGVLGQTDLSTGTVTLGQVSALWGDLQGNPTLTVNDQVYVGRFTNSMSAGKKAQAFQLMYGAADFFFEASADGGSADWAVVGAGTYSSADAYLLVNVYGSTYRIALFSGTD